MPAWVSAAYEDYARRMPPDMLFALHEIKPGHRAAGEDGARARQQEGDRILAAFPAGCVPVVLDERGTQASTRELAEWLRGWMDEGVSPAFVIGGADGLDDNVKTRAHTLLGSMNIRAFAEGASIETSALVTLRHKHVESTLLLVPAGGGRRVKLDEREVQFVTPTSPLGEALVGLASGDEAEVPTPQGVRVYEIVAVR